MRLGSGAEKVGLGETKRVSAGRLRSPGDEGILGSYAGLTKARLWSETSLCSCKINIKCYFIMRSMRDQGKERFCRTLDGRDI